MTMTMHLMCKNTKRKSGYFHVKLKENTTCALSTKNYKAVTAQSLYIERKLNDAQHSKVPNLRPLQKSIQCCIVCFKVTLH